MSMQAEESIRDLDRGREDRTPLEVAIDRAGGALAVCDEQLAMLVERLGPVLGPEHPMAMSGDALAVPVSSMRVDQLHQLAARAEALGERIAYLRDRIEA